MRQIYRPSCSLSRRGFTLIEILVTVSIVGLLIALLIPAVISARRAVLKTQCSSNLRQLGVALHSYIDVHNSLPKGYNGLGYSYVCMLLPQLEQAVIYNSINFSVLAPFVGYESNSNSTIASLTLSSLICPADPIASASRFGRTSYTGNGGYNQLLPGAYGVFGESNPEILSSVGLASILDGTSHTAVISEWAIGNGSTRNRDPLLATFNLAMRATELNLNSFADRCTTLDEAVVALSPAKRCRWICGGFGDTLFNCVLTPNLHNCINAGDVSSGLFTASSHHSGGVNVLFADGHVDFIVNTIHPTTWRSLGTRSGNEIISDSNY